MKFPFVRSLLATLFLAAGVAHAATDEASVKKNLETFVGGPAVDSVKKTPYGGLYEVVLKSGELIYTDATVSFIIDGSLIDAKTRKNVTQARMAQLLKIDFATLPLDQAIKQVRGNGKRVIASFEDPNCGYCKRFEREMRNVNNVTVYLFLYPILSPDSAEKSRNIWCAKDRAAAWNDYMQRDKTPDNASCDTAALQRNLALGKKHKITGTPTLIFANGTRVPGAIGAPDVEKRLAEAASATTAN